MKQLRISEEAHKLIRLKAAEWGVTLQEALDRLLGVQGG